MSRLKPFLVMALVHIFLMSKIMLNTFSALAALFPLGSDNSSPCSFVFPLCLSVIELVFYTLGSSFYRAYYSIQIFSPILWALFITLIIYFDT